MLTKRPREHSKGLRVIFGEYSDIVENDIKQRVLDFYTLLYSGGGLAVGKYVFLSGETQIRKLFWDNYGQQFVEKCIPCDMGLIQA